MIISRPAIITATDKFPFPGWTDSLAAGGAVIFGLGMGFSHRIHAYKEVVSTFIPCDYVVNAMLVGTAIGACAPKPDFLLYHVCPSHAQPKVSMFDFVSSTAGFLKN